MGQLAPRGLTSWNIPLRGYADIRERRARIPRACLREAERETQTHLPDWGLILGSAAPSRAAKRRLVRFPALLLTQSLPRKRFFGPALLAGLHVEAVLLYFLDDVFLLHFALEAAQCIFQRFTLLDDYFCQFRVTPNPVRIGI